MSFLKKFHFNVYIDQLSNFNALILIVKKIIRLQPFIIDWQYLCKLGNCKNVESIQLKSILTSRVIIISLRKK